MVNYTRTYYIFSYLHIIRILYNTYMYVLYINNILNKSNTDFIKIQHIHIPIQKTNKFIGISIKTQINFQLKKNTSIQTSQFFRSANQ